MSTEIKVDSGKKILAMVERGEWTVIPDKLPISGKRGAIKLNRLRERAKYLQRAIGRGTFRNEFILNRSRAELAALEYVVKTFVMYEELLKKGPQEEE